MLFGWEHRARALATLPTAPHIRRRTRTPPRLRPALASARVQFRTAVVTKFTPEDYADFLGDEWPLDKMQPIKIFVES